MGNSRQLELRNWLDQKFREKGRGAKAALAARLGISPETVSRMTRPSIQGYRIIKADELLKMAEFFGDAPPGFAEEQMLDNRREFIELVEKLTPEKRGLILQLLKALHRAGS